MTPSRSGARMLMLSALVVVAAALALAVGSVGIPLETMLSMIYVKLTGAQLSATWTTSQETILFQIRLPRVLLAGLTGASLALAGAVYQGLFRNPMGDPYLLGVASGAALGATVVLVFLIEAAAVFPWLLPAVAFLGAVVSTAVIYVLARVERSTPVGTLLLAGVAMGSLLSAITTFIMLTRPDRMQHTILWLFGSFASTTWSQLGMVAPYLALGGVIALLHARPLNLLLLDEEQAQHLGIDLERTKLLLVLAATLLASAPVAVAGPIGFVGLIAPHVARLLWSADHRVLLPTSAMLGATFVILADLFARTAFAPIEMPIGVISALCGGPFFLYLLRQRKRAVW